MKKILRKIKSGFIILGNCFSALILQIKKIFAIIKCLFLSAFSREEKTYIENAAEKIDELFPKKCYLMDGVVFNNAATVDLSIIIAAYNVENFVAFCLDSIVKQNTKYDIEIIIVNDGSTDKTSEMIKPYLSDKRIKYFEQKNQGQSVARNFAISNSVGKYIMIVDSDDIIADGSIDYLMDLAIDSDCDIAEGKVQMFNKNAGFAFNEKFKIIGNSSNDLLRCVGYSVAKVYKRELWGNVSYPVGCIFEDTISKFVLRRKANRIALTDSIIYGYRVGHNSSSHGGVDRKIADGIRVLYRIWELCDRNDMPKDKIFYLLSLNHIGLINYILVNNQTEEMQQLIFSEMQIQREEIEKYKPKGIPLMFRLLDKSVKRGKIKNWQYIAEIITRYKLLKKYREIN